jgi:ATP-dependent HslUV protease ATP-binding subunit HslU
MTAPQNGQGQNKADAAEEKNFGYSAPRANGGMLSDRRIYHKNAQEITSDLTIERSKLMYVAPVALKTWRLGMEEMTSQTCFKILVRAKTRSRKMKIKKALQVLQDEEALNWLMKMTSGCAQNL